MSAEMIDILAALLILAVFIRVLLDTGQLDFKNRYTRGLAAAKYHLIAMILIRTAENFLESWQATGHKMNHRAYGTATKLYTRAYFAMRQASNAALFAGQTEYTKRGIK